MFALAAPAGAQELEGFCLDELDGGGGLDLEVDELGRAHLSRVRRVPGDVVYTIIDHDGEARSELVVGRASRLGVDEIEDTDLLVTGGRPHICFYNATEQRLEVAIRGDGPQWAREVVAEGVGAGRWCALGVVDDELVVAYGHDGALWFAYREGVDAWSTEPVDDGGPDNDAGFEVSLSIAPDGTPAVAHRDRTQGRLHITFYSGFWQTVEVDDEDFAVGVRPSIAHAPDGRVFVAHGVSGVGPLDQESDGGLMLTRGRLPGPLTTDLVEPNQALGGSNAALVQPTDDGERVVVLTRQLLESALFPDAYDVRLYDALPDGFDRTVLTAGEPGGARRLFARLGLQLDPFDGLVAAFGDDALVCVHRGVDSDNDGLPDEVEADFETNPLDPDSDDDGVSDGLEVLRDETNPNGEGPLLEPDAAVPDAALPDAALPDAALPDAALPDAALPDAALPDAALPDAALPDAALTDAVASDAVELDAAAPSDAIDPDVAEIPDATQGDAPQVEVDLGGVDLGEADQGDDAADPDVSEADLDPGDDAAKTDVARADGDVDAAEGDDDMSDPDAAPVDATRVVHSDVRLDSDLPALNTYADERGLDCACSGGGGGGLAMWWLIALMGLRRRR